MTQQYHAGLFSGAELKNRALSRLFLEEQAGMTRLTQQYQGGAS